MVLFSEKFYSSVTEKNVTYTVIFHVRVYKIFLFSKSNVSKMMSARRKARLFEYRYQARERVKSVTERDRPDVETSFKDGTSPRPWKNLP